MDEVYEDWSLDEDEGFVDRGGAHNPVTIDAEVIFDLHEQGYNKKEMGYGIKLIKKSKILILESFGE